MIIWKFFNPHWVLFTNMLKITRSSHLKGVLDFCFDDILISSVTLTKQFSNAVYSIGKRSIMWLTGRAGASSAMYLFMSAAIRGCRLNTDPSTATATNSRSIRCSSVEIPDERHHITARSYRQYNVFHLCLRNYDYATTHPIGLLNDWGNWKLDNLGISIDVWCLVSSLICFRSLKKISAT